MYVVKSAIWDDFGMVLYLKDPSEHITPLPLIEINRKLRG